MCLSLYNYITPSGLGSWVRLVYYNHVNPSGLIVTFKRPIRYDSMSEIPKG